MTRGWPFYPPDYERDTEHLKGATEHGAYFLLLKHYWTHGGLPDDDRQLRKIVGLPAPQWQKLKPTLQAFFYDGWKHRRVDRDLKKAGVFRNNQKRRANVRWEKNTGDKDYGKTRFSERGHIADNTLKNHNMNMPPAMPYALPILRTDRIPSIAARESPGVDKGQPSKQDVSFSKHKSKEAQRAEQAWLRDLLRQQGPDEFAKSIDRLAADPALVERATEAELRTPGSGVMAAVIGLSQHMGQP